jgi:hypothetical protein
MRKNWMVALLGAALCAVMPAAALAHDPHSTHHTKRQHRAHIRVRHLHAASTDSAGSVRSFDGSALVLTLTNGSTVSGVVTNDTEIRCDSSGQRASTESDARSDGGGGDRGDRGDQNDRGGPNNGGDRGDQNDRGGPNDGGDRGDNNGDDGNQMACTTADLTPGTTVHEADLRVSGAGSVWEKVELTNG